MRIFLAILLFLSGAMLVGYSYISSYVDVVREMERSESMADVSGPIETLFDYLMNGGAPRDVTFLYTGALLIVIAVVMVFVKGRRRDDGEQP